MDEKYFYLVFGITSQSEDIFVYQYGEFDFDDLELIKSEFSSSKGVSILVTDINLLEYKDQINKKFKGLGKYWFNTNSNRSHQFTLKYFGIATDVSAKIKLDYLRFCSNLLILEKLLSISIYNQNIIWSNFDLNDIYSKSSFSTNKIITDDFLFGLIKEGYSKYCYAVQMRDYQNKNFPALLKSSSEVFLPKVNIHIGESGYMFQDLYQYSLSIERNLDSYEDDFLKFTLTEYSKNNSEKFKIIYEWNVSVIGDEYNDPSNCLFIIETEYQNIFNNLKKYIFNDLRVYWINEDFFFQRFKEVKFQNIENSCWESYSLFGINFKHHHYYHRYSDFGSDNDIYVFNGDSKYLELSAKKPLIAYEDPANNVTSNGYHRIINPGKYKGIEENVFNYFFKNKEYLILNLDSIPYEWDKKGSIGIVESQKYISESKILKIPDFMMSDTYILTQDYLPN